MVSEQIAVDWISVQHEVYCNYFSFDRFRVIQYAVSMRKRLVSFQM